MQKLENKKFRNYKADKVGWNITPWLLNAKGKDITKRKDM